MKGQRKKHPLQLQPNPQGASDDARSPDGKLVFGAWCHFDDPCPSRLSAHNVILINHVADKKLPRVAHMEKRVDGLQSILATQQKQQMYERALVKYPQCRSNIFAPSIYDSDASPSIATTTSSSTTSAASGSAETSTSNSTGSAMPPLPAPQSTLELDFVYGLQTGGAAPSAAVTGSGGMSNGNAVFYLATGEVMWFTAALVVLYTRESNVQRYFREHSGAVTSMGVHPNQYIVASGQAGRQTHLLVWNAKDESLGKRFTMLTGHTVAVRAISFSHDGKLVASLGGDMYNTICVHDWKEQSLLVTARGHSFRVHTLAFNPFQAYGRPETRRAKKPGQALNDDDACYTLVSCGVRHIRFWTLTKTEYVAPSTQEKEDFAFYGSAFGSPTPLRPATPHEKMWKLEGNVPSFHGKLDVQDFTSLAFVDDSPPLYLYDEQKKELVATSQNDHTLGRIIAGTTKGDLCVFYQPRRSPEVDVAMIEKQQQQKYSDGTTMHESEPAKWWEIPDEYTDAEINELVLEKIAYEPTARLVDVVPHDHETGNRFKLTKQAQAEIDGILKRLTLKPNSATLHARLQELKYSGPVAHQDVATQVVYCKKNGLVISSGGDGILLLWKCAMQRPVRVPGVSTLGLFTPLLTGTFSEGSHQLVPVDQETRTFQLPSTLPGESERSSSNTAAVPKPTSLQWKDDGKAVLVGTSSNCLWELTIASGEWKLLFEARSGPVAACSCHPSKDEVATISQDGYICIWDLRQHCCKRRMHLSSHFPNSGGGNAIRAVCMEFQPFGDELAIGMSNGELLIIGYKELEVLLKKTIKPHSSSSTVDLHALVSAASIGSLGYSSIISQVKYCPKANYLAVGAKDTFVYIYDAMDSYKKLHVCEGHSSAITHLTWSCEGDLLQSNASDGELLHWAISPGKGNMKQITDAFLVRDAQWVKWTCVFGWSTPGIWSEDTTSLVDIAAVCTTGPKATSTSGILSTSLSDKDDTFVTGAPLSGSTSSENEDLIAVACKTSLRLFKWPAMRFAKSRSYAGHSSPIPSICFSFNDAYLVSVGGDDATIIQWKCVFASNSSSKSPTKPSPVARKRPQKSSGAGDEYDASASSPATSPVPPPVGEKNSSGQRSPRQHSRQYRERQEREDSGANQEEEAEESEPSPQHRGLPRSASLTTVLFQARATHDFNAENPDELSFQSGEILRVLSQESDEWWTGERCDGTRGIFPANYLEVLSGSEGVEREEEDLGPQSPVTRAAEDLDHEQHADEPSTDAQEPAAPVYRDVNAQVEAAGDPVVVVGDGTESGAMASEA